MKRTNKTTMLRNATAQYLKDYTAHRIEAFKTLREPMPLISWDLIQENK